MSIPVDAAGRGCAANFPQPVNAEGLRAAKQLVENVYYYNCQGLNPLPDIIYRSSSGENDILHHVFRWDVTPYEEVFKDGIQARRLVDNKDIDYFSLDNYIRQGGTPLDSRHPVTHAFVSTTLNSVWYPPLNPGNEIKLYRYEIYAPGGIWVAETLGDRYQYPAQDEVCFVAGIAPQYIRSAQHFNIRIGDGSRFPRRERVNNELILNQNFNPQSHPSSLLHIRNPIFDRLGTNGTRVPLNIRIYGPSGFELEKPPISKDYPIDWYAYNVGSAESYINAAFRSSRKNEAYLFMKNEYVLLDYAPGSTNDKVVNGPLLICDSYLSLTGKTFAEHGIDCAFRSHDGNEAFIFSGNLCAKINYAPRTTDDKIIEGPMTITAMFPFFKETVFERAIDAGFEAKTKHEAYLFKDDQYALINYNGPHLIAIRPLTQGFASLKNTIFEKGIDAAFASHRSPEAYLFKGDSYALIDYAPGSTNDKIIGGVKKILPNWPSLRNILPRRNRGLDVHDHTKADGGNGAPPPHGHDEL